MGVDEIRDRRNASCLKTDMAKRVLEIYHADPTKSRRQIADELGWHVLSASNVSKILCAAGHRLITQRRTREPNPNEEKLRPFTKNWKEVEFKCPRCKRLWSKTVPRETIFDMKLPREYCIGCKAVVELSIQQDDSIMYEGTDTGRRKPARQMVE